MTYFVLQAFVLLLNGIICDLRIRFQVSPNNLLWAVVDPFTVAEINAFIENNDTIIAKD